MSFLPVMEYLTGIATFGFFYWLMNGILDELTGAGVSETGNVYDLLFYFWTAILLVYLIFGGWWVIRKYNEPQYPGGFR